MSMPSILIVSGTNFLRAYAGTLHLMRSLREHGHPVRVMVRGSAEDVAEYSELEIPVDCLVVGGSRWGNFLRTLRMRMKVFFTVLVARRVIVTENTFLLEAAIAKLLRGRRLVLAHYCQELHLGDEISGLPRAALNDRLARHADFTIDVEPNRARVRHERLGLKERPLILRNTARLGAFPEKAERGGLERLAGCSLPPDLPILLHMGGVGQEKPLERVIDAIAACGPPVYFLAFCNGPGEKLHELEAYATKRLVEGRFHLTGPRKRDELLSAAWEADLGVIDYSVSVEPSSNQRFCAPTKLYEFMALGLAVVGSNNQSLRDIVEAEKIGFCAEGESPADLGRAMERTVRDAKELVRRKRMAGEAFRERHCYEVICGEVVEEISRRFQEF